MRKYFGPAAALCLAMAAPITPASAADNLDCVLASANESQQATIDQYVADFKVGSRREDGKDEALQSLLEELALGCTETHGWSEQAFGYAELAVYAGLREKGLRKTEGMPEGLAEKYDALLAQKGEAMIAVFDRVAKSQLGLALPTPQPGDEEALAQFSAEIGMPDEGPITDFVVDLALSSAMRRVATIEFAKY